MRWRQFFTPVKSMNTDEAQKLIANKRSEEVQIIDVRQLSEYEAGHIPGAKLIPLPELTNRLSEIDPDKPAMVY